MGYHSAVGKDGQTTRGHREDGHIHASKASEETNPADILSLEFQLQDCTGPQTLALADIRSPDEPLALLSQQVCREHCRPT